MIIVIMIIIMIIIIMIIIIIVMILIRTRCGDGYKRVIQKWRQKLLFVLPKNRQ